VILDELRKVSSGLQGRCAPVPWGISGMGEIGHMTKERGLYVNPVHARALDAALQDAAEYERVAREVSGGRLGADVLVPIAQRITDSADVVRTLKRMCGALTSWSQIETARASGKFSQVGWQKPQVAAANTWTCDFATSGLPGAGAFGAIPGGSAYTGSSAGAIASPGMVPIGGSDHCYLTDVSLDGAPGPLVSNIVGIVDLLVGAGSIVASTGTSQAINTTVLPRWTAGEGLCMSLVITANLVGGVGPTIALTYTDQAGNTANSTGAISLTTGINAGRMVPTQDGPMIRFAAGDFGVRQIEGCIITGTLTGGVLAAIIYKPVMFIGVINGLSTARTTPAQTGGMRRITNTAGALPCLSTLRYASNAANSHIGGNMEFVWG